ncbi:MAG: nitrate/nitrite transporter [Eubacteriaceae bacterium]
MKNEDQKLKQSKISMYVIIFIAYFFVNFHRYAGSMSAPVLIDELGFTPTQIGWFGAIFTYCYAFANLPAGILIDKFGSRKLIAVLYIGAAVGTLFLATGNNYAMILIGRALIAAGIAPVYVAACKVIAEWEVPEKFSAMNGYLMAFGRAGGIVAATPLALLMASVGWRNTYYIFALISLVIGIAAWILIRDKKEDKIQQGANPFKGLGKLVGQSQYWLLVLFMMAATATVQNIFSNWGGVFMIQGLGYDANTTANVLVFCAIASATGSLFAGTVVKKTSPRKAVMIGGTVLMIGTATLAFFAPVLSQTAVFTVFIVMGFAEFYTISTGFSLLRTILPAKFVGTAMGMANFMMWGVGASIIAQLWGAWIPDDYAISGFQTAFTFHAVILLVGLISVFFVKEKTIPALENL